MMTGQIFFSPDKPRFWPVELMNIIIFFLPLEYRITLAVDRCTALSFRFLPASWWKIHSHVVEFLSAIFARFMSVYIYLEYHRTAVSKVSKVRPISAMGQTWSFSLPGKWSKVSSTKKNFVAKYLRQRSWFGKKFVPQTAYSSSEVNKYTAELLFGSYRGQLIKK